ncbi:carboxylesterase family protein [Petropleomorpha daqingensis]|uniref:carboxylesterase family protein n=1 Tax=Petropleomorpha daqingensis TaxID=2026353 RepID=UPI0015CE1AE4
MRRSQVQTTTGPVSGPVVGGVRSWRGIPYATADRFGPARPAPAWTEPLDAGRPGPVGVQFLPDGTLTGTEQCLTLDVHAPAEASGPLPVLVWVHGGAFLTGAAADYDGSYLAAHGPAVVVAVSYRLGPFGFLQLGTADRPEPSPAMTDLVAALDWVAREIGAFGGDPDRLTLMGQSAGASLVCALLATGAGRRARAVIALSVGGAPVSPEESADVAGRVLAELDVPRDELSAVPAASVMAAARRVSRASSAVGGAVFAPVLDGAVVRAQPADLVASGELRDTALWFGWCRDEMAGFLAGGAGVATAAARGRLGEAAFGRLLDVYRRTAGAGEDPLQALLTDEMWVRPVEDLAEAQARAGGRAWLSRFDHAPSLPPFDVLGPSHGADNACLWARPPRFVERPLLQRPGGDMTPADLAVTEALQSAVLRTVTEGSPGWRIYDADERPTQLFDAISHVRSAPSAARYDTWKKSKVTEVG